MFFEVLSITYDLVGPKHFDFDPNEAYEGENVLPLADDGKMVRAGNQDDWLMFAIHDQLPNVLGCQSDEILYQ